MYLRGLGQDFFSFDAEVDPATVLVDSSIAADAVAVDTTTGSNFVGATEADLAMPTTSEQLLTDTAILQAQIDAENAARFAASGDTIIGTDESGNLITQADANAQAIAFNAPGRFTSQEADIIARTAGTLLSPQQAASLAQAASSILAKSGSINSNGSFSLPFGLTAKDLKPIIDKLTQSGGQWLARTLGGSTIITRQPGGIGTFDVKSIIVPAAIVFGFMLFSNNKSR